LGENLPNNSLRIREKKNNSLATSEKCLLLESKSGEQEEKLIAEIQV